jgi:hypothetical protein
VLGLAEVVSTEVALAGYLKAPDDLAGPARRIEIGAPADLVLLDRPLHDALADPAAQLVRQTWITGQPTKPK